MRKKVGFSLLGLASAGAAVYAVLRSKTKPVPDQSYFMKDHVMAFAHRGGAGLWPPNTIYAYKRAVEVGVDALEIDVHSTRDGVLVVRHDDTVDETTNGSGAIRDLTLSEIRALDAGYRWTDDDGQTYPFRDRDITIPTLEEVFQTFPEMRINIDIKEQDPAEPDRLCHLIRKYDRADRTVVGSFHDEQLQRFRQICPQVPTAAGQREVALFLSMVRLHLADAYRPQAYAFQIPEEHNGIRIVTPAFIDAAHRHNISVHVWTVDDEVDMRRLMNWGVDGLMSDYPDRLLKVLGGTVEFELPS